LPRHNKSARDVAIFDQKAIGADKLIYQNLDDLIWCVQQGNTDKLERILEINAFKDNDNITKKVKVLR
jgi:glutamine phosphoribosylpyrophosphate amidotransferase